MQAMFYEFFIRRIYKSGRSRMHGADADIYRDMEHAHTDLQTKSTFDSQERREREFRKCFAITRNHVSNAINDGLPQIRYQATKEEVKKLEEMKAKLSFDLYDKEELDKIIIEADDIFQKYDEGK